MMTIRRFRALAGSYGTDLQRWPEPLRGQALALLGVSAEAQAIIARERELDDTIAAAGAARDAQLWGAESIDRALHRLQARVAASTRTPAAEATGAVRLVDFRAARRASPARVGWIGLATAASLAVMAGLALGILYSPAAPPQSLTAVLQPAPLEMLTD